MTHSVAAAVNYLFDNKNAVVKTEIPSYYYTTFVVYCLVPANKVSSADLSPGTTPDCKYVNIGRADRRLFTRAYFDDRLQDTYNSLVTGKNGIDVNGEKSISTFGVQALLNVNPGFGIIQCGIKNGYNEMCREAVFNSI